MSYGKDTSRTGEYDPSQRDPRLQGQTQSDQPSTTGGYQDPSYTRDTGYGLGAETTQTRSTGEPGYGDRTTAQQHHLSRSEEPMRDPGLGRDSGIRGTGPGSSSTTAGTYPGEYGLEGHHFRHGESMAPLSTVPGTSLPATVGGDNSRHEGPIGRHEERKEARREQELGTGGYDEGPLERREEHKGHHHEGPFERHEERKELRTGEELGVGGMSRREAHQASMDEPCMTNVPGTKYGGWEETRGGGLPKQQAYTTTSYPGTAVPGGTPYTETGAQSGRGIHAQQYERHPEHHLGERERRAEEHLTAEQRAEGGYTGRQGWQEKQNLEAQQGTRAGAGGFGAQGYGDTQRTGAGYGDTQRTGAGYGDTQRTGAGYGDTQRAVGATGYGVGTTGTGAHTGTTPGKVSTTDKVIGGGEKLAGKLTSNTALYEQGVQRQCGTNEPQPKQ